MWIKQEMIENPGILQSLFYLIIIQYLNRKWAEVFSAYRDFSSNSLLHTVMALRPLQPCAEVEHVFTQRVIAALSKYLIYFMTARYQKSCIVIQCIGVLISFDPKYNFNCTLLRLSLIDVFPLALVSSDLPLLVGKDLSPAARGRFV